MTGHDDRKRVAAERLADAACRTGHTELTRDIAVRGRTARTNQARRLIDALIEFGHARHVERHEGQIDRLTREKQSDRVNRPAGSYQRAENAIQADVIRLAGPVSRELRPHPAARGAVLDAYLEGRDAAANQVFCFRGLPAGDYTLTVEAR